MLKKGSASMKHSKKETEKLISEVKDLYEIIVIDDKLKKEMKKMFKKIKKEGIESIMKKDGELDDE